MFRKEPCRATATTHGLLLCVGIPPYKIIVPQPPSQLSKIMSVTSRKNTPDKMPPRILQAAGSNHVGAPGYRQDSIFEARKLPRVGCKIQRPGAPGGARPVAVGGGGPTLENFRGASGQKFAKSF